MFLLDSVQSGAPAELVFSASDLVTASECEYRTLRILDEKLGRAEPASFPKDEMLERAAKLGDVHERAVLQSLIDQFGPWDPATGSGVLQVPAPAAHERESLEQRHEDTVAALRAGADVVFQATFFDGGFLGFADFIVRQPDGRYAVWDSKLARHAKVSALIQLAAYGDQLVRAGFEPHPVATLVLGNLEHSDHPMPDLLPVFRERRDRFRALTGAHRAAGSVVAWSQPGVAACGRCDYCAEQVAVHRDLLLVGGMTMSRRKKLLESGITTIDELAALPDEQARGPLERLRDQARMQAGTVPAHGSRTHTTPGTGDAPQEHTVSYRVLEGHTIGALPPASPGDIFFDFEGDPLWQDPATGSWGIEYLFGVIEADGPAPVFRPFWAHSRAAEKQAFLDFLDYVEQRRKRWPDLHVYHYAAYEKSALRNLSLRHTAGEDTVDAWLREGLLVDLYDTVRHSLRISERSYSIKKLEPLYMGENLRAGDVTDAGASVVAYSLYCAERDDGAQEAAERTLASIADYNEYDCLSTLRLRDWLLGLAAEHPATGAGTTAEPGFGGQGQLPAGDLGGGAPDDATSGGGANTADGSVDASAGGSAGGASTANGSAGGAAESEPTPEELALQQYLQQVPDFAALPAEARARAEADHAAVALVAAATGYHRREEKQFWWGHFDRLESPVEGWEETRDVFIVDSAQVLEDWHTPPRARTMTRLVQLHGRASDGSDFREGSTWFRMFDAPVPDGIDVPRDAEGFPVQGARGGIFSTVLDAVQDGPDAMVLTIREKSSAKVPPYGQLPMALTPDQPIRTASIREALAELAREVGAGLARDEEAADPSGSPADGAARPPSLPRHPGIDILRRLPPRLGTLATLPAVVPGPGGLPDYIGAITAAVADLDHSYLAVQGPPGTGKTYVGSHVIATLVGRGWKIGVVGQSHAVVEHMLTAAVEKAGVDPDLVGKKPKDPRSRPAWTRTDEKQFDALLSSPGGALLGGTAWTMTGRNVPAGALDLLVIDEAGQYSLANTLAVSRAARRLLLLGDPQQLPQVTQGTHPEPVDASALGWLSAGHATLPPALGYFLADTWRMHPALCARVSRLSYDRKLDATPAAAARRLDGVPPGVETVMVEHRGNSISSPEEADEVLRQVRRHVGLTWDDGGGSGARPLEPSDILVVAAYNAHVNLVRTRLNEAGLDGVRVGTVDRFQGQEAPVVLVSMACSAASEAPRGMEFLLNRNRINVAVSRGQWRAVLIRSPELTSFLPSQPAGLAELGAFIGLCADDGG